MAAWLDIRSWLMNYALPLWANAGFDQARNSFAERLTLDGVAVHSAPRRLMVQARQIYSYAKAQQYRWMSGAGDLVTRAAAAMVATYHEADGRPGWVMSVDSSGQIVDATRDLYAHSFVLLGLAAAFQSTKDKSYLEIADLTLLFLDKNMACPAGGYYPAVPLASELVLTQNPHMHLLEAVLALYEVAPKQDYQDRAHKLVSLFETSFFTPVTGTLSEYFTASWTPADRGQGTTFEPGHHFEWIWLLKRYSELFGQPLSPSSAVLNRTATRHGRSVEGLLWSEVRSDGLVTDPTFRLWPHTEAVKASLSGGDMVSADLYLAHLQRAFLNDAHPGGWNDRIGASGELLVGYMPASSFYHLVCAFSECERIYGSAGS